MADDKGSPFGDLGKGIFHLYRAAKKTVAKLPPAKNVERAVSGGAREVRRAVDNVRGAVLGKEAAASSGGAVSVFVADVKGGEIKAREGRLAFRVLSDVCDAVRAMKVAKGSFTVRVEDGQAEVETEGGFSRAQRESLRGIVRGVAVEKLFS